MILAAFTVTGLPLVLESTLVNCRQIQHPMKYQALFMWWMNTSSTFSSLITVLQAALVSFFCVLSSCMIILVVLIIKSSNNTNCNCHAPMDLQCDREAHGLFIGMGLCYLEVGGCYNEWTACLCRVQQFSLSHTPTQHSFIHA